MNQTSSDPKSRIAAGCIALAVIALGTKDHWVAPVTNATKAISSIRYNPDVDADAEAASKAGQLRIDKGLADAAALERKKEYLRALIVLQPFLDDYPNNPLIKSATTRVADVLYKKGFEDHRNRLRDPQPYIDVAYTWVLRKEYDSAFKAATRAIQLTSNSAMAHLVRGDASMGQMRFGNAVADYNKALAIDPNMDRVYLRRGIACLEMGRTPEAISDLKYFLEKHESATARNFLGIAFNETHDLEQALNEYTNALKVTPNDALQLCSRANVSVNLKRMNLAKLDVQRALSVDPESPTAHVSESSLYRLEGRPDLASKQLESVHLTVGQSPILVEQAELKLADGKFEEGEALCSQALGLNPKQRWALRVRSVSRSLRGDNNGAYADIVAAMKMKGRIADYFDSVLLFYAIEQREKQKSSALSGVKQACELEVTLWPRPILDYITRAIPEQQLLKIAMGDWGSETRAHTYIGYKKLADGYMDGAKDEFKWVQANGRKDYLEYILAVNELKSRNW